MRLPFRPSSIRVRLLLASTAVQVVLLTLLVVNSVRLMNEAASASLDTLVEQNASMLHAMATAFGEQERYPALQDLLGELLVDANGGLAYVRIGDSQGRMLLSAGRPELDPLPQGSTALPADIDRVLGERFIHIRRPLLLPGNEVGFLQFGVSVSILAAARKAIVEQGALIASAELLLTFLLISSLGYLLSGKVRRLLNGSRAIADGHFEHRLPVYGNDELSRLARHFNLMAATLQERVGELQDTADRLASSEDRYALAMQGANDGLWDWDIPGNTIYYSERFHEIAGNTAELPDSPQQVLELLHPDDVKTYRQRMREHLQGASARFTCEHRIRLPDGSYRWVVTRGVARRGADGHAIRMAGSMGDVDMRKQAEQQLVHDALHDGLTGLPNRALFIEHVRRAIGQQRRDEDERFAVLAINLERFSLVNDSYGHATGDALLRAIAGHISASLRAGDIVARVGGDQFAVLLDGLKDSAEALRLAESLVELPAFTLPVTGQPLHPKCRIGVALGEVEYEDAGALLRDADNALHKARQAEDSPVAVFHASMHAQTLLTLQLETDLRHALRQRALIVHYQPIVTLPEQRLSSMEALVRWPHPTRGLLAPNVFIPLAEALDLVHDLGMQVLEQVCADLARWQREGYAPPPVSVNLSARQLSRPALATELLDAIARHGIAPTSIRIEVTESLFARPDGPAKSALQQLREAGITVLIDDFGTGFSALSYLHTIPCDTIKLDGSFVRSLTDDARLRAIVRRSIELVHDLGITVVAECIETEDQAKLLHEMRCDYGQGYLFSRPQPAEALLALLPRTPALTG